MCLTARYRLIVSALIYLQNSTLILLIAVTVCLAPCHHPSPWTLVRFVTPDPSASSLDNHLAPTPIQLEEIITSPSSSTLWDSVPFLICGPCCRGPIPVLNSVRYGSCSSILAWPPARAPVSPQWRPSLHSLFPFLIPGSWIRSYHRTWTSSPHWHVCLNLLLPPSAYPTPSCPCLLSHPPFAESP